MRYVNELPHATQEEKHVTIPMSDGIRLSARIWRPASPDTGPVPAVLEYIPYRKNDLTSTRDAIHHPYIAGHGYACVRVDLRGTGESEGVLRDEYLEQEQRDAEEVLAWIAAQPWCDGNTGMMGISWGAFAALQVAARRPPSLRAICIASFTDDRYADDMHYLGGAMLSDNLAEAGTMFAYATCPPDPAVVGDRWREMWRERLDAARPWVLEWLRHQQRDDYWRHASLSEDYSALRCPVLASSGWADGYSNAVTRLLAHVDVPRKGLIGPWSHKLPHLGEPGPAIGYLQEVVRWWDHWLKGADNGVMDGPVLQAWMQESMPPSTAYEERPGRWVGEPSWPSPNVGERVLPLRHHALGAEGDAPGDGVHTVLSPLSVGQFAGKWASYNAPPDLPYDQREEDGGSLVFETGPLSGRVEILGSPVAVVEVSADAPVAQLNVRLSDVAPDGRSTRVTYGVLNLTHRDSEEKPEPLEPGRRYRVRVPLHGVAQVFPPGHRVRLSLSTSYWPLVWPAPEPVLLTVYEEGSTLTLPVRPADGPGDTALPAFGEPEGCEPPEVTRLGEPEQRWTVSRDLVDYRSVLDIVKDRGLQRYEDNGIETGLRAREQYSWVGEDFGSVRGESAWEMRFRRPGWDIRVETRTVLTCDTDTFRVDATLDGYEDGRRVFSRTWNERIPREHL
ncbi:CocE/NonD family hydrolase [Streptomyces halstedii]|uniref:CocE/NonD family hydrolase n=1 Tax=Streptomyces halstedii TaxID=1944 RepID=A0ABS6TUK8_STRHA|nr:CocE/NonD family hydrolase [Streptomyces halstedii]MBV7671781.1 CocE/NonD family hydrolase [Streptomyces halstedii]